MNDNEKHNDGLDILLREAVRSREEILHHMEDCSNKIFALSNISLVLLGAYVTSILLMGADKRIVVFPFLLAAGLAMGGLTAGLLAMFPRYYDIIIVPTINPSQDSDFKHLEKRILINEFKRYREFALTARNRVQCLKRIEKIELKYGICGGK